MKNAESRRRKTASAVMHVIKRGIIEEAIQQRLCENCEDNEDCEI